LVENLTKKTVGTGVWTVEQRTELTELTVAPGAQIAAPEGKSLVMTVDGVTTDVKPGDYCGKIVLEVLDAVPKFSDFENEYRCIVYADADGVRQNKSALSGLVDGEVAPHSVTGGTIEIHGDCYNGIAVNDGTFRITDTKFEVEGRGGDDFEAFGAAITTGNRAEVVIDHVDIHTHGCISAGIITAGDSEVLVKDSTIDCEGDTNEGYYTKFPHLTEVPWVLGLRGTLRSTNVLDQAVTTYYNCHVRSNGWGVLSVDFCEDAYHTIVNTDAIIDKDSKYASGYGAYILNSTHSTFLGVQMDVPDIGFAAGGSEKNILVGPSSQELLATKEKELALLKRELGGSLASVPERPTVIRSGRFGGMWHHKAAGTWDFRPTTVIEAGDTAFFIKSDDRINNPTILCDGVTVKAPRIVHLMQSDDSGIGNRLHDGSWSPRAEFIKNLKREKEHNLSDATLESNARCEFKNMTLEGDFYNTRWHGQNLVLVFDHTTVDGVISSGTYSHRHISYYLAQDKQGNRFCTDLDGHKMVTVEDHDILFGKMPVSYLLPLTYETGRFIRDTSDKKKYKPIGYGIYFTNPEYLGDVDIAPSRPLNNGVIVELKNGASWTVAASGYLTALTIGEGCTVQAPAGKKLTMKIGGREKELVPGSYKGIISLTVE
jgi:hypothetical protein